MYSSTHGGMLPQSRPLGSDLPQEGGPSAADTAMPGRGDATEQNSTAAVVSDVNPSVLRKEARKGKSTVLVQDKNRKPLDSTTLTRAVKLVEAKKAYWIPGPGRAIRMRHRTVENSTVHLHQPKVDYGFKTIGIAIVKHTENKIISVWQEEVETRPQEIKKKMDTRRSHRRFRRGKLRSREARWQHRASSKAKGRLAPSVKHIPNVAINHITRLEKFIPLEKHITIETGKFDLQKLENPEIMGKEYQQGPLVGTNLRAFVMARSNHCCAYCGKRNLPLEIEHVIPRVKGGTNHLSNLVASCRDCNSKKGTQNLEDFASKAAVFRVKRQLVTTPKQHTFLKAGSVMNATRNYLFSELEKLGWKIEEVFGYQTAANRIAYGAPKEHHLDAVFCGDINDKVIAFDTPQKIKVTGRGTYSRTLLNKHGNPRAYLGRQKRFFGFATGDLVRADVPKGKKTGNYRGKVSVRSSGSFNIKTKDGTVQGITHRYCQLIQRNDGYSYE